MTGGIVVWAHGKRYWFGRGGPGENTYALSRIIDMKLSCAPDFQYRYLMPTDADWDDPKPRRDEDK